MSTTRGRSLSGTRAPVLRGLARETLSREDARAPLDLTLRLRAKSARVLAAVDAVRDGRREPLSRDELGERFGGAEGDRAAVTRWARRNRVEIVASDLPRRTIELRAPAA